MKSKIILLFLVAFCSVLFSTAQRFDSLVNKSGKQIAVYCSKGFEARAAEIGSRVETAQLFFAGFLQQRPSVTLLVLSKNDWKQYTNFPVYGMPHYNDDQTLVVAAEDNAFWKSFIPPPGQLTPETAAQVQQVYGQADGSISMKPFFDLLAIHELGHAFHFQAGINTQRKWMGELLANLMLHVFVAEQEPASLPALTLFPQLVINGGTKGFLYTSLKDVHDRYDEIGQQHPNNYGWYQSRWHAGAAAMYEQEGKELTRRLWTALKKQTNTLNDEELNRYLQEQVGTTLAAFIRNWDQQTLH